MRSGGVIGGQVFVLEMLEAMRCVLVCSRHLSWYCLVRCLVCGRGPACPGIVACSLCDFSSVVELLPAGCGFGKFSYCMAFWLNTEGFCYLHARVHGYLGFTLFAAFGLL